MKRIIYSFCIFFALSLVAVSARAQAEVSEKAASVKEVSVSMYPIPTTGILHISFNKTITDDPMVMVYDMIGNPVENVVIERENPSTFSINLSGKKPGFYFVKVSGDHMAFSRRITINP
ncbi:MAG: T9SS type A sorting domain-containing protein [Bacteroidia bacterium]